MSRGLGDVYKRQKGFAQSFIPLVTYYKALGDTGLINNVKLY